MELLSQDEALLSLLLPQGVASLRSLALGWELIAPSGRSLVAWFGRVVWTRGLDAWFGPTWLNARVVRVFVLCVCWGRMRFCRCFCPFGAHRIRSWVTQGVASLRSLALGWELIAPSGRSLNA